MVHVNHQHQSLNRNQSQSLNRSRNPSLLRRRRRSKHAQRTAVTGRSTIVRTLAVTASQQATLGTDTERTRHAPPRTNALRVNISMLRAPATLPIRLCLAAPLRALSSTTTTIPARTVTAQSLRRDVRQQKPRMLVLILDRSGLMGPARFLKWACMRPRTILR